jgi:cation diffusion facilitator family transporter
MTFRNLPQKYNLLNRQGLLLPITPGQLYTNPSCYLWLWHPSIRPSFHSGLLGMLEKVILSAEGVWKLRKGALENSMSVTEINKDQANREKHSVALSSVVAAVFITILKIIVGLLTGSLGILAEAAHSGLDLVAAVVTFFAVRISGQPADREHTYGHGKVENLSALFETLLLLVTCVWIIYEAIQRLFFKHVEVEASLWAFVVMIVSIIIDVSRSKALYRAAKKHNSQALEADALHFSTDVWSSAVVIGGLALVRLADWLNLPWLAQADAIAALSVSGIVIYVSIQLGKRTISFLLDAVSPDLLEKVRQVAHLPGVAEVKRVRIRHSGAETFADITVTVKRDAALETAHHLTEKIEAAVQQLIPGADVVVHVEPIIPAREDLFTTVRLLARRQGLSAHAIRICHASEGRVLELHIEVSDNLSLGEAHTQATALENELRRALPGIESIITHIEPKGEGDKVQEGTAVDRTRVLNALAELTQETGLEFHPHEVRVYVKEEKLDVSFHCLADPSAPVTDVHAFTEHIEQFLRSKLPNLGRVVIHVEPTDEEL